MTTAWLYICDCTFYSDDVSHDFYSAHIIFRIEWEFIHWTENTKTNVDHTTHREKHEKYTHSDTLHTLCVWFRYVTLMWFIHNRHVFTVKVTVGDMLSSVYISCLLRYEFDFQTNKHKNYQINNIFNDSCFYVNFDCTIECNFRRWMCFEKTNWNHFTKF